MQEQCFTVLPVYIISVCVSYCKQDCLLILSRQPIKQSLLCQFPVTWGSFTCVARCMARWSLMFLICLYPCVMLLVSMKSKTVFQTDTLYSCLLSLVSLSLVSFSLVSFSLTHSYRRIYICFIATENSSVFNLCRTELVQHNHIHSIHWPFTHPFTCNTFTFNWPFVHATGTCTTHGSRHLAEFSLASLKDKSAGQLQDWTWGTCHVEHLPVNITLHTPCPIHLRLWSLVPFKNLPTKFLLFLCQSESSIAWVLYW